MKVKIELEPKDIKAIHDTFCDCLGLDFTDEQIQTLMSNETSILHEMAQHGIDTCVRESLNGAVAQRLLRKPMPTYGDGEDVAEKFYKELEEKAKEAGIKVRD
jgi:hypothetical protein